MSYCRWGDPKSDLYCYVDSDGAWVTHIAKRRVPIGGVEGKTKMVNRTPLVPIGLPHDGETFIDSTIEGFFERLMQLCDLGYQVPADVFDQVREEMRSSA